MRAQDVAELYQAFDQIGVVIWIDGGWAVDANAGRETRPHHDLDIVVEAKSVTALRESLARRGYRDVPSEVGSDWNFVVIDDEARKIDVHVAVLDAREGVHGDAIDGIAYPAGSLTGEGMINGVAVRCVSAEALLRFKTSYPPRDIDGQDVATLYNLLKRPVPETYA